MSKLIPKPKIITILLFMIIICKLALQIDYDPVMGEGDSTGRLIKLIEYFPFEYNWITSTIWLPFYFILYSLPLHLSFSYKAIILFQHLLIFLNLIIILKINKSFFPKSNSNITLLFVGILPISTYLANSALSEVSFTTFLLISIFYILRFNRQKEKILYFALGTFAILAASMIRYEGWIFYCIYLGYLIKFRSFKILLAALIPFLLCVISIEYSLYLIGQGFLSGMSDNHLETGPINLNAGLTNMTDRLLSVLKFHFKNIGLLTFVIPIAFIKLKRNFDSFSFFSFVIWGSLLIASLLDQVAIFERYWYPSFTLIILLSLKTLYDFGSRIQLVISSLSIVMILMSNPIPSSLKDTLPTISTFENLQKEKVHTVYIDEYNSSYIFYSFILQNLFSKEHMKIIHYNDDLSLETNRDLYKHKLKLDFLAKLGRFNFSHIVLIKGSVLYNLIASERIINLKVDWILIKEDQKIVTYKKKT